MKKILIASQSTIPHYRVPFYNALERLRPATWGFDVVFDSTESTAKRFFKEPIDLLSLEFSTLPVRTFFISIASKTYCYQNFWLKAANYDLVIVENAVNNLTYPLCHLHQFRGTRIAYWGHGKDRTVAKISGYKHLSEQLKMQLSRRANGFFAYTDGVKAYLEMNGVSPEKVFVTNNTIDINEQRRAFEKWMPSRNAIREKMGLQGKRVLIFVGRFIQNRKIDFLLSAFSILCKQDSNYHLILVGDGGQSIFASKQDNISYMGTVVDLEELAPLYVASDVYIIPGAVGLGPVQALCYDLPIITMDTVGHGPEIEYLSSANSIVLNRNTTPEEYAQTILDFMSDPIRLETFKSNIWESIKHLTIDQMAQNFINGINAILED